MPSRANYTFPCLFASLNQQFNKVLTNVGFWMLFHNKCSIWSQVFTICDHLNLFQIRFGSNDKIDFYIRRQRRLGSSWHLTSYSLITSSVLWPLVSKAHRSRHYLSNRSFFGSGRHLRYLLFCLIYYFQETAEIKCTCWKLNRNIIIKDRFVQLKDCLSFFLSLFF